MINLCIAFDEKYALPAQVLLTSLLVNSDKEDEFNIFILDQGLEEKTKVATEKLKLIKYFSIRYIPIKKRLFDQLYLPENSHFNHVTYFRISIPSIISDYHKILYLDCDLIITRSISNLYNINLADNAIGAAKSVTSYMNSRRLGLPRHSPYVNTGVMLINSTKWRNDNIQRDLIDFIKSATPEKLKNADQDVINCVLSNSIVNIPRNWNVEVRNDITYPNYYMKYLDNPYIIHYNSIDKPWSPNTQHDPSLFNYYKGIRDNVIAL